MKVTTSTAINEEYINNFDDSLKNVIKNNDNIINDSSYAKDIDMLFKVKGRHQLILDFHHIIQQSNPDYQKKLPAWEQNCTLSKRTLEWVEPMKKIATNLEKAYETRIGRFVAIFSIIKNFFQSNGLVSDAELVLKDIEKFYTDNSHIITDIITKKLNSQFIKNSENDWGFIDAEGSKKHD